MPGTPIIRLVKRSHLSVEFFSGLSKFHRHGCRKSIVGLYNRLTPNCFRGLEASDSGSLHRALAVDGHGVRAPLSHRSAGNRLGTSVRAARVFNLRPWSTMEPIIEHVFKFRGRRLRACFGLLLLAGCAGPPGPPAPPTGPTGAARPDMPVPEPTHYVSLRPGDDIQAAVRSNPEGTAFILANGVYRGQSIVPKNRQQFIGKGGTILNGSVIVVGWRREGARWIADGLPKQLPPHGYCLGRVKVCTFREDLFVGGRLFQRVGSLGALAPGKWYSDGRRAFLSEDPGVRLVEMSSLPRAFGGAADDVYLLNLIVEKYASAAQNGAIDARDGKRWTVVEVHARFNHGTGLHIGQGARVSGGSYSYNGQMGMGGDGNGAIIEDVEIAFNNYAGFATGWEAGGFKFARSDGLVVRNSCVHHNIGIGMWTDIDNIRITYEGNTVFENTGAGISHEISFAAIIRNNIVARNGSGADTWLWGSQILIQNSRDTEVYGNTVEIAPTFGNGIGMIEQKRGNSGKGYGPWITRNNRVHHNQIIYLGNRGLSGMVVDFRPAEFWRNNTNRYDRNTYVAADAKQILFANARARPFGALSRNFVYEGVTIRGQEANGTLSVEQRRPIKLSCGN